MENLHYCEGSCGLGCDALPSAEREGDDYAQCQNIASRMVQKEALAHAQVCTMNPTLSRHTNACTYL